MLNNEISTISSTDESFFVQQIKVQMNMLEKSYLIVENLLTNPSKKEKSHNCQEWNNPFLVKILSQENCNLKNKLDNLREMCNALTNDLQKERQLNRQKDEKIQKLKNKLKFCKEERNENIFQVQTILKEFDMISNRESISISKHPFKRESISSSITGITSTNSSNSMSLELEKLQKEKVVLENQLVAYKMKYAENTPKIMELEDERVYLQKKVQDLSERVKIKDEIIKTLIAERENLKSLLQKSEVNINNITNNFTEKSHVTPRKRTATENNYKTSNIKLTSVGLRGDDFYADVGASYIQAEVQLDSKNGKDTGSLMSMLKNIFHSDKKK